MPKGPKGEKRPADVVANAVHVMRIATGEVEEGQEPENPAAVLGRRGGAARAKKLTPEQRREIAKKGVASRWGGQERAAGSRPGGARGVLGPVFSSWGAAPP